MRDGVGMEQRLNSTEVYFVLLNTRPLEVKGQLCRQSQTLDIFDPVYT